MPTRSTSKVMAALLLGAGFVAVPQVFEPAFLGTVDGAYAQGRGNDNGNGGKDRSSEGRDAGGQEESSGGGDAGGDLSAGNAGGFSDNPGERGHVSATVQEAITDEDSPPGASEFGQDRGLKLGLNKGLPAAEAGRSILDSLSGLSAAELEAALSTLDESQLAALGGACGGGAPLPEEAQNVCSTVAGTSGGSSADSGTTAASSGAGSGSGSGAAN